MTYSKIMNTFIEISKEIKLTPYPFASWGTGYAQTWLYKLTVLQIEVTTVLELLGFRHSISRYGAYCDALRGATLGYYDPDKDEETARADFWRYQEEKYKPKERV
jgi:hypothetical protein